MGITVKPCSWKHFESIADPAHNSSIMPRAVVGLPASPLVSDTAASLEGCSSCNSFGINCAVDVSSTVCMSFANSFSSDTVEFDPADSHSDGFAP